MQLGEVIRKYRKRKNMTQEEMATRLGVTAPAVNKWEHGNTCPDITLLAPIARLLGITLDTLLSFREELTEKEIKEIVYELDAMLKEKPYGEAFAWAKGKLEQNPDCVQLSWQLGVMLDAQRMVRGLPDAEVYDGYICSLYTRALEDGEEGVRNAAADSLFGFYLRKGEYGKAETYLAFFSEQDPERKRKQAQLYGEMGRTEEAYRIYEELLYADYQRANLALAGMYRLALLEEDREKARYLVDKQEELARCFEMGRYYEISCGLEMAAMEKDADAVIGTAREMLSCIGQMRSFRNSPLYAHMRCRELSDQFVEGFRAELLKCFQEDSCFEFLKEDPRWKKLIGIEEKKSDFPSV